MTRHRPERTRRSVFGTLLAAASPVVAVCAPPAAETLAFIRMTHSGRLNAPINTPVLATGAVDAKVSPTARWRPTGSSQRLTTRSARSA